MKRKRKRKRNGKWIAFIISIILFIMILQSSENKSRPKLRHGEKLVVGILTKRRNNAFYLNDVVSSLHYNNVHIFDADIDHVDLQNKFRENAKIHKIYDGEYYRYLPFSVKTDAHKTHKYDNDIGNDSLERLKWWKGQNMDFIKMLRYLRKHYKSEYYLVLEGDNIFQGNDLLSLINHKEPIVHMGEGAGAIMMSDAFVESLIGYLMLRTDALPLDWLIEMFIDSIGRKMVHNKVFKHVGSVSTKPTFI